jgi:Eukaryotic aspartyl protease
MRPPTSFFLSASRLVAFGCAGLSTFVIACGSGSAPNMGETRDAGGDVLTKSDSRDASREDGPSDANLDAFTKVDGVTIVSLAGCYNSHTVPVTLGGSQPFDLLLDTGSGSLGVAARGCSECVEAGVSNLYQPGPGAVDLHRAVSTQFDVGELGWSGEAYRDTASIGDLPVPDQLAAIRSETDYFSANFCDTPDSKVSAPYQGIVGFGPDNLVLAGTTGYFDQVVAKSLAPDVFAIELCHVGGKLWLGGYAAATPGPIQYTPMTSATDSAYNLYSLAWTAFAVGSGAPMAMPAGALGTAIDSGGEEIIVPDATFQAVAGALEQDAAVQKTLGAKFFSSSASSPNANCTILDTPPAVIDAMLPTLTVTLGSTSPITVQLTATQSYLTYEYSISPLVSYCQTLIDGSPSYGDLYYLGQSLMIGRALIYDRAGKRFGVAPGTPCPF